ncbi:MAG: PorP/SprF family type IX secretion system membrane protein, partial [Bacteroidales bacterium]|nr:PorP/SprF family type IX secretion system membrane protein [Bacteroidales bacterium]
MDHINLKWGIFGTLLFIFSGLQAQDPQFSQFYNNSLYYNPATAGITQDLRFSSSYRNLWSNIPGDLSTYFISIDYQWSEKNMGLGFLMLSDNEGLHHLRTQRMEFIYSYRLQSKYRMLQFCMTAFSINFRDFKNNDFVFTDQLDPIYGVVQQSSFVQDEIEPVIYPDWNIGLVYRQNFIRRRMTPTIGFSASHIFRPNISFLNNEIRLPIKYVLHANMLTQVTINNDDVWKRKFAFINPGFVYEYQDPFQTFTIGSGFDVFPI